jgi:MFS family permease
MKDHSRITHSRRQDAPSMNLFGLSLVFMTPMLLGFLYGFDIGATSFVLSMLLEDQTTTSTTNKKKHASKQQHAPFVWWQDMGSLQQGLFVSALSLGALLGSHLVLMSFSQRIGRRLELQMCSILYLVGTAWNVAAGTWLKSSVLGFYSLLLGRIIFGIGVAFVMHG